MTLTFERKLLRVMRLTSVILLTCCIHVAAKTVSQTVTYKGTNVPLEKIFSVVEQQTGYLFIYNPTLLEQAKPVTVAAEKEPLENFLKSILSNQLLDYEFNDRTVIIKRRITSAQAKTATALPIAGVVKGVDGKPLANVSVIVKGTNKGTTTDAEGKFNIDVNPGEVLVVSSVGFGAKEVKVNTANKNLIIALEISSSPLDEVQIIAYGATSRRLQTGNVSVVKAAEIQQQPINNPLIALQGRTPGLFVEQSSGLPGTGVKLRIQGQNSLLKGNDPLYVIDGVPYSSQLLQSITGSGILGNSGNGAIMGSPFSFINPDEIESITVLKDADATAIYGSRAASGAILITRKKGVAGPAKVSMNIQDGFGQVMRKMNLMNAREYLEMRHEALRNDGKVPSETEYDVNGFWDTTLSRNWQRELIGGTARYSNLNASVSGGSDNIQYLIGSSYHRETTVFPGSFSDRKGAFSFNINAKSDDGKFAIQLSGSYLIDNNHLPDIDLTANAMRLSPVAPSLYDAAGNINWMPNAAGVSTFDNPLSYTLIEYRNKTSNVLSNSIISYELVKGLLIKSSFGYSNLQSDEVVVSPLISKRPENRSFELRGASYGSNTSESWIIEPQLEFSKQIGRGNVEALLGTTIQEITRQSRQVAGTGHISDAVLRDIRAAATLVPLASVNDLYRYNALFARLNYNIRDKYLLNLTGRRDGSSRFGDRNKFHNFGAVGLAWIFSEEKWLKENLAFVSFGKIRASYGTTGNDQISDYAYYDLYDQIISDLPYQGIRGIQPLRHTNPFLQWEETKKLQIGLDLEVLQGRIAIGTTYFRNRSSNQLLGYDLPNTTGFGSIERNFPATVQNTGMETVITARNISTSTFSWSTSVNFTLPKNKLVSFPNIEQSAYNNFFIVGKPVDIAKLFPFAGVDPTTGVYQFRNNKGNLTFNPVDPDDRIIIRQNAPVYYGGLQNNFRWKGIELSTLLQFVKQDGPGFGPGNSLPGFFNAGFGNQPRDLLHRWQLPDDRAYYQAYNTDFSLLGAVINAANSDMSRSDASYIRLKNVSLSWTLPETFSKKIRLVNGKVYANAQNLFTVTRYNGLDPETKSSLTLPPLRTIIFGIQVTF